MDLEADKKVDLDGRYTDEVGNPTTAPDGASVVYSVDRPDLINLTDNGDGSAVAAAIGPLGIATVHADSTLNGDVKSADFQLVVVAGLADRFEIVAGDVTEVTEDGTTPAPAPAPEPAPAPAPEPGVPPTV